MARATVRLPAWQLTRSTSSDGFYVAAEQLVFVELDVVKRPVLGYTPGENFIFELRRGSPSGPPVFSTGLGRLRLDQPAYSIKFHFPLRRDVPGVSIPGVYFLWAWAELGLEVMASVTYSAEGESVVPPPPPPPPPSPPPGPQPGPQPGPVPETPQPSVPTEWLILGALAVAGILVLSRR